MKLKELQARKNTLAAEMRKLGDAFSAAGKKWADEEQRQSWEQVNADYNAVEREIGEARAAADVEARLNTLREEEERSTRDDRNIPGREDSQRERRKSTRSNEDRYARVQEQRTLAVTAWCRNQFGAGVTKRQREACRAVGLNPTRRSLTIHLPRTHQYRDLQRAFRAHHPSIAADRIHESRALSAYGLSSGGVLVPDTLVRSLEVNMLAFGGIRQVAQTIVTSHGEEMSWPTADDTTNEGEQIGENTSIGSHVGPSFGGVTWNAYKFSSKPILVPYELLEDEEFGLPSLLGEMLGERLGRITSKRFTTGSGASTAKGIVTASALGVTAASQTAIAADEIFQLIHSVDPAYRIGSGFLMNDAVMLHLRLLKDGNGNYLWQNGMRDGVPDRLNGYTITISQEMASTIESAAKVMLFGQLSRYKIRRVNSIRMYRLQERYRDVDQDGFLAFIREDGNLLTAGTPPVKYLQMA